MSNKRPETKLVPVPSVNKIPERDVDKSPILEAQHLGIDFGGLTAVNEFNMAIGRTEIAGLIGPNGAGKTTVFNLLTKVYQPTRGTILPEALRQFSEFRMLVYAIVLILVMLATNNPTLRGFFTRLFRREKEDGPAVHAVKGGGSHE